MQYFIMIKTNLMNRLLKKLVSKKRNKGIAIGLDKGKREIILRMLNNNVSDSDIIKYSGVTESELEDIKKSIGK